LSKLSAYRKADEYYIAVFRKNFVKARTGFGFQAM